MMLPLPCAMPGLRVNLSKRYSGARMCFGIPVIRGRLEDKMFSKCCGIPSIRGRLQDEMVSEVALTI